MMAEDLPQKKNPSTGVAVPFSSTDRMTDYRP